MLYETSEGSISKSLITAPKFLFSLLFGLVWLFVCSDVSKFYNFSGTAYYRWHLATNVHRDKLLEKFVKNLCVVLQCSYLNVIVLIWMCLVLLTLIMSFLPMQNWKLSFRYLISNPMCVILSIWTEITFIPISFYFFVKWLCDIPHRISGKLRNSKASPNSLCLPQPSISIRLWKLVYSFYSFFTTQEWEGPDSKRVRLLWKGKTPFPIMLVS